MGPIHRARRRDDRGAVLILFALSVGAMATVAALVLGASTGYSASRSVQTSVDAAAVAATATLRAAHAGTEDPAEVHATAVAVAESNGATPGSVTCDVVTAAYGRTAADADVLGACDPATVLDPSASGVRVSASDTRAVPFGAFVDSNDISATARAAATAQPLDAGRSPFMICSSLTTGDPSPLVADASVSPPYALNEDAIGTSYVLWGNDIAEKGTNRDCGNGSSSWRGLVKADRSYALPSTDPDDDTDWWQVDTGNKTGQVPARLAGAGACAISDDPEDLAVGCTIAVPICPYGNGETGANFRLYCVTYAAVQITYVGKTSVGPAPCHTKPKNNVICATLVGAAVANGGQGVADTADPNEIVTIKLVE